MKKFINEENDATHSSLDKSLATRHIYQFEDHLEVNS